VAKKKLNIFDISIILLNVSGEYGTKWENFCHSRRMSNSSELLHIGEDGDDIHSSSCNGIPFFDITFMSLLCFRLIEALHLQLDQSSTQNMTNLIIFIASYASIEFNQIFIEVLKIKW
jgi:hypothetical protein